MRTQAKLISGSILLAGFVTAMLSQMPSLRGPTLLSAAARPTAPEEPVSSSLARPGATQPQATLQEPSASSTIKAMMARPQAATEVADAQARRASPAQTMASKPLVIFRNGLLSIRADNSIMGDVLRAVQLATGASIDIPDAASERVSVKLGPAGSRDVLTALLNGSRYDYILLAPPQLPSAVERIVLTVRRDASASTFVANGPGAGEQPQLPRQVETPAQAGPDMKQIVEQQELQFQKQFGACIAQGCDAS
jgi:hypothetical protein